MVKTTYKKTRTETFLVSTESRSFETQSPASESPANDTEPLKKGGITAQLTRINGQRMSFCFGCQPEHDWPEHSLNCHKLILIPEPESQAELSWRLPDGHCKTARLDGNHVCFISKNVCHAFRWKRYGALICLHLCDGLIEQITTAPAPENVRTPHWWELARNDLLIWQFAPLLSGICRKKEPHTPDYFQGLAVVIVAHLIRSLKNNDRVEENRSPVNLRQITDWIDAHLQESITSKTLAAVAGVSRCHLTNLFNEITGMPPHRYVMMCRLRRATELIAGGTLKMSAVATATGFADQSHLSRWLRKIGKKDTTIQRENTTVQVTTEKNRQNATTI